MANEIEPTAEPGTEVPENAVLDLQTEESDEVEAHGLGGACVSVVSLILDGG